MKRIGLLHGPILLGLGLLLGPDRLGVYCAGVFRGWSYSEPSLSGTVGELIFCVIYLLSRGGWAYTHKITHRLYSRTEYWPTSMALTVSSDSLKVLYYSVSVEKVSKWIGMAIDIKNMLTQFNSTK